MNTSSKYANLPFIASGERDIFESDDLPEADQVTVQQPIHDASIEIIPSGTSDAFQKFASSEANQSATKVCVVVEMSNIHFQGFFIIDRSIQPNHTWTSLIASKLKLKI